MRKYSEAVLTDLYFIMTYVCTEGSRDSLSLPSRICRRNVLTYSMWIIEAGKKIRQYLRTQRHSRVMDKVRIKALYGSELETKLRCCHRIAEP